MKVPRSVLVVEDSQVQRQVAAQLCRHLGVSKVYEAEHGLDALAVLDRLVQPPEAMIIDLEMPVMDGVQLIERLGQRGLRIPFILASTREAALMNSVESMARLQNLPVVLGLAKPLREAPLRDALERMTKAGHKRPQVSGAAAPALSAAALARAIASGTIQPHYQPKVCARSGLIHGVEVLARWVDADLGHPGPDRFIALAEAEGQIHALTLSLARQALAQAARWNARGLVLNLALNLSPRLLTHSGLADEFAALTQAHGLQASQITFEVTEGSLASAPGVGLGVLARLRMKGFGLSIDDYGTGYSSLQRLALAPWTELKIDRSFVNGAHASEHQQTILQSAIEMATRLKLSCVAEGVETMADWRLLQQFGCTLGQGWLFGPAVPAGDLPAWLKTHAQRLPELRALENPPSAAQTENGS